MNETKGKAAKRRNLQKSARIKRIEQAMNQLMEISNSLEQENRRLDFDTLRSSFNWPTVDDALYVFSMIESEGCSLFEAVGCLDFKKDALEQLHMEYEKTGDANLVFAAIEQIVDGRGSYPAPDWVRSAWRESYSEWQTLEAESLDQAFGVRRTHLNALRKNRLGHEIFHYVHGRRKNEGKENVPLDDILFEDVANFINERVPDELKIKKTTAKNLYYKEESRHKALINGDKLTLLTPFLK